MKLSIGQAANETGKSKSTISRAIKQGRISAEKLNGKFEIDPSELFRVFPAPPTQPVAENEVQPTNATHTQHRESVEISMLREMLERERETVEDLRTRLTRSENLLTNQRPKSRKWFWQKD